MRVPIGENFGKQDESDRQSPTESRKTPPKGGRLFSLRFLNKWLRHCDDELEVAGIELQRLIAREQLHPDTLAPPSPGMLPTPHIDVRASIDVNLRCDR